MSSSGGKLAVRREALNNQLAIVNKMKKPLRVVYRSVQESRRRLHEGHLGYYRELGGYIDQIVAEGGRAKYGDGAVEQLAIALDISDSALYKAASFHRGWTDAEFKQLCETTTQTGDSLTWTHVLHLLLLSDNKKKRLHFQNAAAAHNWSSDELLQAIREDLGDNNRRPRSGRRFAKPKNCWQGLRNFCSTVDEYRRRDEQVYQEVFDHAATLPPDSVNEEMVTQIERVYQQANGLMALATERNNAAKKLLDHYRDVLAAKADGKVLPAPDDTDLSEDDEDDED